MKKSIRNPQDARRTFTKTYTEDGETFRIVADVRYGDALRNGHNTFLVTGSIDRKAKNGRTVEECGGCIHDEIEKHFPELKNAIRFHMVRADGPLHYVANTLHFASVRDCWGRAPGDSSRTRSAIRFGDNPIRHYLKPAFAKFLRDDTSGYDFEVIQVAHGRDNATFKPKYTVGGYAAEWHTCPFETEDDARRFVQALQTSRPARIETVVVEWSEGKAPELDAARAAAHWPDATLEQLNDKTALEARLPDLMEEFRGVVESFGFTY